MKASNIFPGRMRAVMFFALVIVGAALLAGCGTISGHSQNCSSSGGFFSENEVRCEGTADSLGGKMGIEFGDDDDFSGEYRLTANISVEEGEADVLAGDDEISVGRVSAGSPVAVDETVALSEDSMVFTLDAGEEGEVNGLSYEGTVAPR